MRSAIAVAFFSLAVTPSMANAFEGSTSSGSITIRVEIPPIAAALQAQAEGAVGLASVSDAKSAVMVSLPSEISSEEGGSAAIYVGSDMPVTFMPAAGSALSMSSSRSTQLNGMIKNAFTFAPLSNEAIANPGRGNGVALLIMAV